MCSSGGQLLIQRSSQQKAATFRAAADYFLFRKFKLVQIILGGIAQATFGAGCQPLDIFAEAVDDHDGDDGDVKYVLHRHGLLGDEYQYPDSG